MSHNELMICEEELIDIFGYEDLYIQLSKALDDSTLEDAIMTKTDKIIADNISNIGGAVYNDYGVNCRQYGARYILMVLDMAKNIIMKYNPDQLTPEVQNILTEYNAHPENHAINVIKSLEKYALFEYATGGR